MHLLLGKVVGSFRGQRPTPPWIERSCRQLQVHLQLTRLFLLEVVVDEEGGGPLWVRRVLRPLRPAQGAPRARAPSLRVHEADGVGAGEPVAVAQRPADQRKIYDMNEQGQHGTERTLPLSHEKRTAGNSGRKVKQVLLRDGREDIVKF